jgi:hypothetical protein
MVTLSKIDKAKWIIKIIKGIHTVCLIGSFPSIQSQYNIPFCFDLQGSKIFSSPTIQALINHREGRNSTNNVYRSLEKAFS